MLRALLLHLTRPPKRKHLTNEQRSRSSSNPGKGQELGLGTASVVIESDGPPDPSVLDQKVSALGDRIDATQTKMGTFEKETEVLKERLASLGDQLVALEKVTRTPAPSLQTMIVDEAHKIIIASQTVLLTYINNYILGPVQKLKF